MYHKEGAFPFHSGNDPSQFFLPSSYKLVIFPSWSGIGGPHTPPKNFGRRCYRCVGLSSCINSCSNSMAGLSNSPFFTSDWIYVRICWYCIHFFLQSKPKESIGGILPSIRVWTNLVYSFLFHFRNVKAFLAGGNSWFPNRGVIGPIYMGPTSHFLPLHPKPLMWKIPTFFHGGGGHKLRLNHYHG